MASAKNDENWQEPVIPFDKAIQRAVLGTVLYDPPMYQVLAVWLRASDFYGEADRILWKAFDAIVTEGGAPDELVTIAWLERHHQLAEAGGAEAIWPLSTAVPPDYRHAATTWAHALLELAERRANYALGCALVLHSQRPMEAAPRTEVVKWRTTLDDIQHRMRGEESPAPSYEPLGVSMADVKVETFDWLWRGRIAFGKITMADGDPGLGKSLTMLDLVARAVMGYEMPDNSPGLGKPASAVIVCGEDGLGDTVAPRLLAAGVSPEAMKRIRAINLVPELHADGTTSERLISLVNDLPNIEATIKHLGARILIIDPITAYLGNGTDMYKDSDLRRVLTPVALMAERTGVAVVAVRHLNKSTSTPALHRGLGGVGFIGVARLGLLFAPNPDADGEVLVSRHKGNIGAPPPTLAYRIVQIGEAENMPRVSWVGERETTAGDALATQTGAPMDREARSATDVALKWLLKYLANGPRSAKATKEDAVEAGIITDEKHDKPLRTARERICLTPYKVGMVDGWWWELDPEKVPSADERASSSGENGVNPESKPTPPKMPTHNDEGHLRPNTPPKMPTSSSNGHLRTDAVEFSDSDMSGEAIPPKMPIEREKGNFEADDHLCKATGGSHIYAVMRDAKGRRLCTECQEPAVGAGA